MRLLVDTDAFCKLAVAGMLHEAIGLLGVGLNDCGRLPALPHMLRRGGLQKTFGAAACDALIPIAEALPVAGQASEGWLNKLTLIPDIDPGEAQLFAGAAEGNLMVLSGDKRALRALRNVVGFAGALSGRIVVLEAILLALCDHLGPEVVRERVQPLCSSDKVVQACFSPGNPDPAVALLSYCRSISAELHPLVLWEPHSGGRT